MSRIKFVSVLTAGLMMVGCDSDKNTISGGVDQSDFTGVIQSPVNVLEEYLSIGQAQQSSSVNSNDANQLSNGGFEDGLTGWTACGASKLSITSDSYLDEAAALLEPGTCFFQTVPVEPGRIYTVSCYARITSGADWTGLGLGFSDDNYALIEDVTPGLITRNTYQRYDVAGTAPAQSAYATVWMYSDNDVVVDGCQLMEDSIPPEPPAQQSLELLDNREFNIVENGIPLNWSNSCDGDWTVEPGEHGNEMVLSSGTCALQGLSASDVTAFRNKDFTATCEVLKVQNYATFGVLLDGHGRGLSIPHSNEYQRVTTGGNFGDATRAAFVIQLHRGSTEPPHVEPMRVRNCSVTVDIPVPSEQPVTNNYLLNESFEDLAENGYPNNWEKGCGGKWSMTESADNGTSVSLTGGACLNQAISSDFAMMSSGQEIAFSCDAKNISGYSDITLFVDGVEHKSIVPPSGTEETVVVTVPAQSFKSVLAVIYAEGEATFNKCSLVEPGALVGVNLLRNSEFEQGLENWRNRCDGFANHGRTFDGLLHTGGGSCVHQFLTAEAVEALRGNDFEYSCTYTSSHDEYAEIATNIAAPGEAFLSTEMPRTYFSGEPAWQFETVTIQGTASEDINVQNAIMAINSEGENGTVVIGCSLKITGLN